MQLLVVLMLVLVAGLHDANAFSVARKQRQPMKPIKNLGLAYTQPEQIHISYGTRADQMVITWTTIDPVDTSMVAYGLSADLDMSANGTSELFVDDGFERRHITIHRVLLSDLKPNQTYAYQCGSPVDGWSSMYSFTTRPDGEAARAWSPRFAVYGDMGNVNAQSLTRLQRETFMGMYDAILHVGDFAYDMHTDNGRVGDAFMNQIQPIAATLPYMTCVGNHEAAYNFSNYVHRFSMPNKNDPTELGKDNNHFYSINIGPIHLISFSTEFYYFLEFGILQVVNQFEWLEADLREANLPGNRARQPWIITMGHRPMYCTNSDGDCDKVDDRVRTGLPYVHTFGLEELFYKYGVDVEFWAHEHSYERLFPIYNYQMYNGSDEAPYTNPGAPVHIVTGSAGCQENHDTFGPLTNFTAFRAVDYGYTRMQVFNASHLYMEQVSDDKGGQVIDSFWLIKDRHGSY